MPIVKNTIKERIADFRAPWEVGVDTTAYFQLAAFLEFINEHVGDDDPKNYLIEAHMSADGEIYLNKLILHKYRLETDEEFKKRKQILLKYQQQRIAELEKEIEDASS